MSGFEFSEEPEDGSSEYYSRLQRQLGLQPELLTKPHYFACDRRLAEDFALDHKPLEVPHIGGTETPLQVRQIYHSGLLGDLYAVVADFNSTLPETLLEDPSDPESIPYGSHALHAVEVAFPASPNKTARMAIDMLPFPYGAQPDEIELPD